MKKHVLIDIAAAPGFEAGGYEYDTLAGAERLRVALADFDGGRVLVSVLRQPFKCPPVPFQAAYMIHEHFQQRVPRRRSTGRASATPSSAEGSSARARSTS